MKGPVLIIHCRYLSGPASGENGVVGEPLNHSLEELGFILDGIVDALAV